MTEAPANLADCTGTAPWMQTDAPQPPTRRLRVSVTTDVGRRFEYEAIFRSSFDAYDDALVRFPHVSRIEVQAVATAATAPNATAAARQPLEAHHAS